MPLSLPASFRETIVEVHGEAGREWLTRLPQRIDAMRERWGLRLGERFDPLTYSYVIAVMREDATPAVLKASFPSPALACEIGALREFAGRGAVRLLDADAGLGFLLLERLEPGTALANLRDDESATSIAAALIREIPTPIGAASSFPTTAEWAGGLDRLRHRFGGGTGPFEAQLVSAAETLFRDLLASTSSAALLHGDLHHRNMLAAHRRPWLAIDPKGVVGDPAYEVGALVRNPMPELLAMPNPKRVLARRLDQLALELGLDRDRLSGWAIAQAVLAAWWSFEDRDAAWEQWLRCAELLLEPSVREAG